jgi:hypothetical protein
MCKYLTKGQNELYITFILFKSSMVGYGGRCALLFIKTF